MIRGLLLAAALLAGAAGVRPARAQLSDGQSVTCESNGRLTRCQAALTWRGARLVRQLSQAPCLQGETWGFERNAIWVDQGCRGAFEAGDPFANIGERVVCASAERGRAECPADTRFGVRLVQRISKAACEEGRGWGTVERAIWVDRGCRGEFEVGGPERDQVVSPQVRRFSCGSEGGRTTCPTGGIATGVRLVEDRSGGRCRQGTTWGSADTLIWTDRGCRGLFEVSYHGAKPAEASSETRRITCGSSDGRETSCPVGGAVTASRLVADYSAGRCRQPNSWGHTVDFVWTSRGCQGEFDVTYRPMRRRPVGQPGGATRVITCGTFTGRQATCSAGGPVASMRLRQDLGKGECLSGDTWGHAGTSIWATRGCRGEFEVVLAEGGRRAE
jgi:Protein of unknown function (DUF3011)